MHSAVKTRDPSESPKLSVIVPTLNEAESLPLLCNRISRFAEESGLQVELVIVDDSSPDGTSGVALNLADTFKDSITIRVLVRPRNRGVSSALFEGMRASRGDFIVMMDADNSHDAYHLSEMLAIAEEGADVVVGSRYIKEGEILAWPLRRRIISLGATWIARLLFDVPVKDPMSGFALYRRRVIERLPDISTPHCYKLLLEVLVRVRPAQVREVPISFRDRENGQSKLSSSQIFEYLKLVAALLRSTSRSHKS